MIKLKDKSKNSFSDINYKGANNIKIGNCIKIKNSKKTFQIVGLNDKRKICWVREWPIKNNKHITFQLSVNNILIPTIYGIKNKDN
tara:strand:- start:332 stop:589 length:258 start_codon:yes stop_codon:yes gene_type:complete